MQPDLQPPSGRIAGSRHYFPVRVHFEDTDLSGIAYHANYLKWCERARSDLLRLLGIDQRAAHEAGEGYYAVSEANVKWRRPARFEDVLTVESRALELRAASARLLQRVFRGEDLLAEITIVAAFLSADGRPRRQPEIWRRAFETFIEKDPA
ncbi:YbgC/FadM family acyl-CoA thioesterase [Erythrobacter arachoides]|uniref:YbgC/FadM family acyl-CoA thioesterase n=1 Tax=Aurantiacibacter arachoides TaxID=1850444 RepID=A0A845A4V3_9SPHN|nr:YbgC/FadM family acyl-CoA thioesterase [Aurantiacibacter arachoides]MXO93957.1 YbgC/FadM family acyl-CoA thioesterase [Aurantiacibacter arachoides]GGD45282.1 tol-pal system-associated acyl-CoA thioesterase [Aurantiacibacter arachoides]